MAKAKNSEAGVKQATLTLLTGNFVYKVIQKSQYMGKIVSLFAKHALYRHLYTDETYGYACPTHGQIALTCLALCAHLHV